MSRVLAVERLRKVNALLGFTRIDDIDRVGDLPRRLARLTRTAHPSWTVATEEGADRERSSKVAASSPYRMALLSHAVAEPAQELALAEEEQ